MIKEERRPLNLNCFEKGDIVRQYRSGDYYRISGRRIRSECLNVRNLTQGQDEIKHPREFDLVTDPLVILATCALD